MALAAGGLGGGGPGGSCGAASCGGGACIGCREVLAFCAGVWVIGVLLHGGTGAGAFPFDTGGVGSELACMAGLAGLLTVCSLWIAAMTVDSALSNNCSTWVVSSSVGLSGVLEALVLWK